MTKLKLNEIFSSIQGEGPFIGKPTTFVRFQGCNLNCSFCDSKYTWDKNSDNMLDMVIEDVANKITSNDDVGLCFTGGEPLLYQKEIYKLLRILKKCDFFKSKRYVMIETNGTIEAIPDLSSIGIHFMISPKLSNANLKENSYSYHTFSTYLNKHNLTFKFVAGDTNDVEEISSFINTYIRPNKRPPLCARENIYIMPKGTSSKEILDVQKNIIDSVIKYKYCLTTRLHTLIWENKKGV